MAPSLAILCVCADAGLSGCQRPLGGRDLAETTVSNVLVSPAVIRAGIPVSVTFQLLGEARRAQYAIGDRTFDCSPEPLSRNRMRCVHPGLQARDFVQGGATISVFAHDRRGRISRADAPVTLDFECPRVVALSLSEPIAEAGDSVVLTIETSEDLETPPIVERLGRPWETPEGDGRAFSVRHLVTIQDPGSPANIDVRLVDPAGNRSMDCAGDGAIEFAVDHMPPVANIHDVRLERGLPGEPSLFRAGVGAFLDDVGIQLVRLRDDAGNVVTEVVPNADGSVATTALGGQTRSRVWIEVVDRFGRTSARVPISERWRLSLGGGTSPSAAVRTGVRMNAAPPDTVSMHTRTVELSPSLFEEDTRQVVVNAAVGFEKVGELPLNYEDANLIPSDYDPVGRAIVAVGGLRGDGNSNLFSDNYLPNVSLIRWDETLGRYRVDAGPMLSRTDRTVPDPLYSYENLAFNDEGCALLNGGIEFDRDLSLWTLCFVGGGYEWTRIEGIEGLTFPVEWDRVHRRWVSVQSESVQIITAGPTPREWTKESLSVPTIYGTRSAQAVYFDRQLGSVVFGLAGSDLTTYLDNQWTITETELARRLTFDTGSAYDEARRELILWGGGRFRSDPPFPSVHILTGTATNAAAGWRISSVVAPLARSYPSVVYDEDREVTLVFGGIRLNDDRPIPPDIHQLTSQPSFPHLQTVLDLVAQRPLGIERLHLEITARGSGDTDGIGPQSVLTGGVTVRLWDYRARKWVEIASTRAGPTAPLSQITVDVDEAPSRYVSDAGLVALDITSRAPATEGADARLEVDRIDGYLDLGSSVGQP